MFKQFILRKAVESQLRDVPPETKAKILSAVEKNPGTFQQLRSEIKAATDQGKDQMTVMKESWKNTETNLREF